MRSTRRSFLLRTGIGALLAAQPLGRLCGNESSTITSNPTKSVIIRGRIFAEGSVADRGVRIENGLIVAVSKRELGTADRVITLGPREILLPAAIDTNCAFRDWNEAHRDTVETATKAALAGGVTVVCDLPNTSPRVNSPERIRQRVEFVAARSYTDFGIHASVPRDLESLGEFAKSGAFALTVFQWDHPRWNEPLDMDEGPVRFRRYADLGLGALVYPDEWSLNSPEFRDHAEAYGLPAVLRRLDPRSRVRIVTSLPQSVERTIAARERVPNAWVQAAPHALLMSREKGFERIGVGATNIPPLRCESDVARMRKLAEEGKIDLFVSSHAAHRMADKYNTETIPGEWSPKVSFSSIDFAYPLLLSRFGVEMTCRCFCENPAKVLGLRKGRIAPGYEADVTIMEEAPDVTEQNTHVIGGLTQGVWRVDPGSFYSMGKVTPFVGERLSYRVLRTFLRGEQAYDGASGTFTHLPVRRVACHTAV